MHDDDQTGDVTMIRNHSYPQCLHAFFHSHRYAVCRVYESSLCGTTLSLRLICMATMINVSDLCSYFWQLFFSAKNSKMAFVLCFICSIVCNFIVTILVYSDWVLDVMQCIFLLYFYNACTFVHVHWCHRFLNCAIPQTLFFFFYGCRKGWAQY